MTSNSIAGAAAYFWYRASLVKVSYLIEKPLDWTDGPGKDYPRIELGPGPLERFAEESGERNKVAALWSAAAASFAAMSWALGQLAPS
jgi:hypothetical protein